jgi:hypothetical protein
LEADRTELNNQAANHPELGRVLVETYEAWARRAGVLPWEKLADKVR